MSGSGLRSPAGHIELVQHEGPKQVVPIPNFKHSPAALPASSLGQQMQRFQREQLRANPVNGEIDLASQIGSVDPAELNPRNRNGNLKPVPVSEHSLRVLPYREQDIA